MTLNWCHVGAVTMRTMQLVPAGKESTPRIAGRERQRYARIDANNRQCAQRQGAL